jgi:hypothetical protein
MAKRIADTIPSCNYYCDVVEQFKAEGKAETQAEVARMAFKNMLPAKTVKDIMDYLKLSGIPKKVIKEALYFCQGEPSNPSK